MSNVHYTSGLRAPLWCFERDTVHNVSLTWEGVTCPRCLELKPETIGDLAIHSLLEAWVETHQKETPHGA